MSGIPVEDVSLSLVAHDQWVRDLWPKWRRVDGAYCDDFYGGLGLGTSTDSSTVTGEGVNLRSMIVNGQSGGKVRPQINLVKPWVTAVMASLPYSGTFTVTPDRASPDRPSSDELEAVNALVNAFFDREEVEAAGEQALQTSLTFDGGGAFKLGMDLSADDPIDCIYLEVVQPYEYVIDRRALTADSVRFAGHCYYLTREEYEARFGAPEESLLTHLPDVIKRGPNSQEFAEDAIARLPKSHVRLFEMYDRTTEPMRIRFFVYQGGVGASTSVVDEITPKKDLAPLTWASKKPAIPLRPVVVDNPANKRLYNIAPVNSTYELNVELNSICADMATGYRKDFGRVGVYDKAFMTEELRNAIAAGTDNVLVPVDSDEGVVPDLTKVFQWVPQQPVSETAIIYRKMLKEDAQATQLTAGFTRGTPGQYLSATEVNALGASSEAVTGRIATRMSDAICGVARLFIRALIQVMEAKETKSISVALPGDKTVKVTTKLLDREWKVTLAAGGSTPSAEEKRKQEFLAVQPLIIGMAQIASSPDPKVTPELKKVSQRVLDMLVSLWDLPQNLDWASLSESENGKGKAGKKDSAPQNVPTTGAAPTGAAPPPSDTVQAQPPDLSQSPAAQAMANSVVP